MGYKTTWYQFTDHPLSDSCWSLSTGPDGRIYIAACCERCPGETVRLYRYNEKTDKIDYLFDLDKMVDDPRDSGRATQCKIHYSFAPSMSDGILYMATHLSGPPIDLPAYSPWGFWHDKEKCFRGSALLAYDTKTDKVLSWDTMIPKEGCRCMVLDEERGMVYSISYPRDHMIEYNLKTREKRDLGRVGSINSQIIFLDSRHCVWTSSDYGKLVRFNPDKDRLEMSPYTLPHNPQFQTGWHSVFYDAVITPDKKTLYACTWIAQPRLLRIHLDEGEWGSVEDLGPATQERDLSVPTDTFLDHCGGVVHGGDGKIYYVASRWKDAIHNPMSKEHKDREGVVWRLDPETLQKEEVACLDRPDDFAQYVSRGAVDRNGDLFFAHVGKIPVGIFKVHMPRNRKKKNAHLPIRIWG